MSKLLSLQNDFQHFLLYDDLTINQSIVATEKVSKETRLNIYGYAYRARLIEALSTTYPTLHDYLGDQEFEEVATSYIKQYPSTFRSIRWFGDKLSLVLQHDKPDEPYLAELAKIEWIMTLTFDASDATNTTLDDVQHIPAEDWEKIHLTFHPSLQLLNISWNTIPFWQSISDGIVPEKPMQQDPVTWIFWRHDLTNQFCALSNEDAWAIRHMQRNRSFGTLCEELCHWRPEHDAIMHAASLLKSWIASGLIANIRT